MCLQERMRNFQIWLLPRHTWRYHMEEITRRLLGIYIYKLLLLLNRAEWMKGICLMWSRGRHFSPSLLGNRYLKLGSKSVHRAEIPGNIVRYGALAPRPEVLRFWYLVCACAVSWNWISYLPYASENRHFFRRGVCLLKFPKTAEPTSAGTVLFMSSQHRSPKPSNFTVLLVFVTLKTCLKISFPEQADYSLTTCSLGLSRNRP